jgi:hypothetical protein
MKAVCILCFLSAVIEHWFEGFSADQAHVMHSVSKTFTATAIGFAVDEGLLTLGDKVIKYFPDKRPSTPNDNLNALEIRHLISILDKAVFDDNPIITIMNFK